jgi:hypothetical protein
MERTNHIACLAITSSAEDLVVGQEGMIVGTLTVEIDANGDLAVTYTMYPVDLDEGGWELLETHLYVGWTNPAEDLNSAPGQFPYSEEHDHAVLTFTYTIPIADINSYSLKGSKKWVIEDPVPGVVIYIAAHAEIGMVDGDGNPVPYDSEVIDSEQIEETTWADGFQIREYKNWAMYFTFDELP